MSKIICGFAGIGKSHAAKNIPGVVDLESTPFDKDWDRYAKVVTHMLNNGYTVLLSCHKELRDKLREIGTPYFVYIPDINKKSEYMQRYKARGNTEAFVDLLDKNWGSWITDIQEDEAAVFTVNEFLDDRL